MRFGLVKTARKSLVFFDSCAAVDFFGRGPQSRERGGEGSPDHKRAARENGPKKEKGRLGPIS